MEDKKKNTGLIIIIVILSLIVVTLGTLYYLEKKTTTIKPTTSADQRYQNYVLTHKQTINKLYAENKLYSRILQGNTKANEYTFTINKNNQLLLTIGNDVVNKLISNDVVNVFISGMSQGGDNIILFTKEDGSAYQMSVYNEMYTSQTPFEVTKIKYKNIIGVESVYEVVKDDPSIGDYIDNYYLIDIDGNLIPNN